MSARLSPDEGWRELRLHIDWAAGFSLVLVFSDAPAASRTLLQRLDDAWRFRTAPVLVVEPRDPHNAAVEVFAALQSRRAATPLVFAPAWVQLMAAGPDWDAARTDCLGRLNEGREWLVKDYARPLVLCLPVAWQAHVASVAPDLWHGRSFTLVLADAPGVADVLNRGAADHSTLPVGAATAAPGRQSLHERIARARAASSAGGGDATRRDLATTLGELSAAELEQGRIDSAIAAARESVDLMRQLRQALGDSPQVLDDLALGLERLAGSEPVPVIERRSAIAEALELCQRLVQAQPGAPGPAARLAVAERIAKELDDNPDPDGVPKTP